MNTQRCTLGIAMLLGIPSSQCLASNFNLPPDFDKLVSEDISNNVANILPPEFTAIKTLSVSLLSNKKAYRSGEKLKLTVSSNADCYLTLINVAQSGNTTVLLPNRERPNNLIKSGKAYTVPGEELLPIAALKVTKSNDPVNQYERIEAICRSTNAPVFDTDYNFSKYLFRTFSKAENWRTQTTGVTKVQEAVATLDIIIN